MSWKLPIYALLITLIASSLSYCQIVVSDQQPRTWTHLDGRTVTATLTRLHQGQVTLQRTNGTRGRVLLSQLSRDDQQFVMDVTGWGRVWTTATGAHFIADFRRLEGSTVYFENLQGKEELRSLADLSGLDKHYVRARTGDAEAPDLPFLHGKVVGVTDGDTLRLLINKRSIRVRLEGIDCPEKSQAYGTKAKQFLSEATFGKQADVRNHGKDKYGRTLGRVFVDGRDINAALVEAGLAWHYKTYSDEQLLADLEFEAKKQRIGLWSQSGAVPPWEWRRWGSARHRQWFAENGNPNANQVRGPPPTTELTGNTTNAQADSPPALTHWLNTSSGVRHNEHCRWYKNTKRGRLCKPNEGRGCGQCGG